MKVRVARIDHIQIAAPAGCEASARDFYGSILGLAEIEKPPCLRARGGCWFECGSQQLHIGVEEDFRAAKKAHPAFAVYDLDGMRDALMARGIKIVEDENLPGVRRFYAQDPWGNQSNSWKFRRSGAFQTPRRNVFSKPRRVSRIFRGAKTRG